MAPTARKTSRFGASVLLPIWTVAIVSVFLGWVWAKSFSIVRNVCFTPAALVVVIPMIVFTGSYRVLIHLAL